MDDEGEGPLPTIDQQEHVESEPALKRAADDVTGAQADIRDLLAQRPARTWTIREIQDRIDGWSGTIVSLALLDMRRAGELGLEDDFSLRVIELKLV